MAPLCAPYERFFRGVSLTTLLDGSVLIGRFLGVDVAMPRGSGVSARAAPPITPPPTLSLPPLMLPTWRAVMRLVVLCLRSRVVVFPDANARTCP